MSESATIANLPLPPGSRGLPLLGENLEFIRSPAQFISTRRARYGDVFSTHILGSPTVYLLGPEANRWIFAGEGKYLQNQWTAGIRQLLGQQSLAMINGDEHRERRRLLLPHFSQESMRGFVPTMQAITERHLEEWANHAGVLTIYPAVQALVFEIAVTLILGDGRDVDQPYLNKLFHTWTEGLFTPLTLNWPVTTFGRAMQARKAMFGYIEQLVRRRMRRDKQPDDILAALLATRDEAGNPLPVEAIVDEVQLLLFAGHDTTVSALSAMLLLLAQHPKVLAQARAEQSQFAPDEPLTPDQFRRMPYLLAVINESLRYIPPINGAFRVTTQDVAFGGYRIPEGWTIAVSIRGTHRGEPWAEADNFMPERWLADPKPPMGSFIPFGGGPRVCLGTNFALVEMSVVLTLLLRRYTWELEPNQDLSYQLLPTPRTRSGTRVTFRQRS
ncbi:MAG: cytochrome P450 [Chloroflexaceae bacterium]|jgi:cytochrome P450|nr:cytochrome P450 [Chloroflexaceae bacterium]